MLHNTIAADNHIQGGKQVPYAPGLDGIEGLGFLLSNVSCRHVWTASPNEISARPAEGSSRSFRATAGLPFLNWPS